MSTQAEARPSFESRPNRIQLGRIRLGSDRIVISNSGDTTSLFQFRIAYSVDAQMAVGVRRNLGQGNCRSLQSTQGPSALWSLGAQATQLLFDAEKRRAITDQATHNQRLPGQISNR